MFRDDDGTHYMYFGGLWGGQLQRWRTGRYDATVPRDPMDEGPALGPRVVSLSDDMKHFAEPVREIRILDENGEPIGQQDRERRFFEASWMHKYRGKYYFSYSTGDTHLLVYATGDNPYGPFTYQRRDPHPGASAGRRTTPSSSSRGSGGCSTTTRRSRRGRRTCGA